jgi:hypothetical protein
MHGSRAAAVVNNNAETMKPASVARAMPARFEALASSAHLAPLAQTKTRRGLPANRQFQFQESNDLSHLVKVCL